MENDEINNIAGAVAKELAKLNADNKPEEKEEKEFIEPIEKFNCPECGASVAGGIAFCQACGCPLEWEE